LFYRGPDAVDSFDPAVSMQSIQAAVTERDLDSARFLLFEHVLHKSKMHTALLWLAFANLPGKRTKVLPPFLRLTRCQNLAS
jgi:hypothetical protein